ncbi:hypothetical protein AMJ39_09555 [candidate division TA06 bacterium DG_24]|uniref:Peptidase A2 domain-containing protein n=1 Tax=candidate division TA06 bacterium DG_24 TaxID=1703770 RepID=A0A0S7WPU2_UNCT6|nr:MAG: hypothetical protein AMJ39_09555 [candidate division TA06 bacterium DG_24]
MSMNPKSSRRLLLSLGLLLFCAMAGCLSEDKADTELQEVDLAAVLGSVRAAIGFDALRAGESGLVVDATGIASGLPCEFHYILLSDGRFRMECDSELGSVAAFTGSEGFRVDYTGMPYPLEHWSLEVKTIMAWTIGYYWLSPECPWELRLGEDVEEAGSLGIAARMPLGVVDARIRIDTRTRLPRTVSWSIYGDEDRVEFDDYRDVGGFLYPYHIQITEDGGRTDIRVRAVAAASQSAVDACGTPVPRPRDAYFNLEVPAAVPSAITNQGLLVKPRVDGCDDAWFILDTGTSCNVIDRHYADDLRMETRGRGRAIGVGGTSDIVFRQGAVLTLGPVAMVDPVFVQGEYSYRSRTAEYRIGGILGFDFLARCVAEVDIASGAVSIHRPGDYANDCAIWREIVFATDVPALECTMAGDLSGIFYIDSAYSGNVTFHKGYVAEQGLLEGRELEPVTLGGYGGDVSAYRSEIDWFELGGKRFERPAIILACSDRGASSDRVTAGTVGGGLLSQFETLIFDYPGKRIGFVY